MKLGKKYANDEYPIMLRITKNRQTALIGLKQSCSIDNWDNKLNFPKRKHPNYQGLSHFISKTLSDAKSLSMKLGIENKDLSAAEFKDLFTNNVENISLFTYFDIAIENQKKVNAYKTANGYLDTKNSLSNFLNKKDTNLKNIDITFLNKYEQYLRGNQIKETSMSVYFRAFRAVYNKAIVEGHINAESSPFKNFKISKFDTNTRKRALTEDELKKILHFDTSNYPELIDGKNFFVFSFYCKGMNFTDLALLEWKDIKNKRLEFNRSKTKDFFSIEILERAQKILDYYRPFQRDNYVFPILDKNVHIKPQSIIYRIKRQLGVSNKALQKIAELVGVDADKLTFYVARHTWATTMKRKGVSQTVISESMGHSSEKTTKIYLASFENNVLDDANRKALEDL